MRVRRPSTGSGAARDRRALRSGAGRSAQRARRRRHAAPWRMRPSVCLARSARAHRRARAQSPRRRRVSSRASMLRVVGRHAATAARHAPDLPTIAQARSAAAVASRSRTSAASSGCRWTRTSRAASGSSATASRIDRRSPAPDRLRSSRRTSWLRDRERQLARARRSTSASSSVERLAPACRGSRRSAATCCVELAPRASRAPGRAAARPSRLALRRSRLPGARSRWPRARATLGRAVRRSGPSTAGRRPALDAPAVRRRRGALRHTRRRRLPPSVNGALLGQLARHGRGFPSARLPRPQSFTGPARLQVVACSISAARCDMFLKIFVLERPRRRP